MKVAEINQIILENKSNPEFKENDICDGYHTFREYMEFRKMYNAALFNAWANPKPLVDCGVNEWVDGYQDIDFVNYDVHKSWRHYDGELCFGGGWFIVSAMLPTGLISNHYKEKDWDLFKVPIVEKAIFPYDGHTGADVLERLKAL